MDRAAASAGDVPPPESGMLLGGGGRLWLALGGWVYGTVLRRGLPGQFCAPLQLHRGLNRLDALASCSNGLTKRGLEPLIGFDQETPSIRSLQAKGLRLSRDMFALRTDSDLAHLAAIRAGCGIGICQVPIARRDADLVRLMHKHFAFNLEIWLVMHENLRASPPMRAVFDHLGRSLSAYVGKAPRRT